MAILHYDCVDSTNTVLKKLALQGAPHGTVVTAKEQTGGKGRLGRSFQSVRGLGLFFSFLYRPEENDNLMALTPLCAVAVCKALESITGQKTDIKWPNDLLINGKKICGILVESVTENGQITGVIIGIGMNLLHQKDDFLPELRDIASSVLQETGITVSCEQLEVLLSEELLHMKNSPDIFSFYKERCITLGRQITILNSEKTAVAVDLDQDYGLVAEFPDGSMETLRFGEVSVRGIYGYSE